MKKLHILRNIRLGLTLLKYGWKLAMFFSKKYEAVEKEAKVVVMSSDDKAKLFNRGVFNEVQKQTGRMLGMGELNNIREVVWAAHNPSKQPKTLQDPRLRFRGKRKGKSARGRPGQSALY